MKFFAEESCGQCTPCRVGTAKALELMEAARWDQALLEELSVGDGGRIHLRPGTGGAESDTLRGEVFSDEIDEVSVIGVNR